MFAVDMVKIRVPRYDNSRTVRKCEDLGVGKGGSWGNRKEGKVIHKKDDKGMAK